jgi:hypothetical protein
VSLTLRGRNDLGVLILHLRAELVGALRQAQGASA